MKKQASTNTAVSAIIIGTSIILAGLLVSVAIRAGFAHHTDKVSSVMRESICGDIFAANKSENKQSFQFKDNSCFIIFSDGTDEGESLTLKQF